MNITKVITRIARLPEAERSVALFEQVATTIQRADDFAQRTIVKSAYLEGRRLSAAERHLETATALLRKASEHEAVPLSARADALQGAMDLRPLLLGAQRSEDVSRVARAREIRTGLSKLRDAHPEFAYAGRSLVDPAIDERQLAELRSQLAQHELIQNQVRIELDGVLAEFDLVPKYGPATRVSA